MSSVGPFRYRATTLAAVILVTLLPLLAVLQYRWIGEVSNAERERLRAAPNRFAEEFDREVTRAFLTFQPGPPAMTGGGDTSDGAAGGGHEGERAREVTPAERKAALVQQARRWRSQAPVPQLLRDLYVAEPAGSGGVGGDAGLALSRLDATAGQFVPATWPAALAPLARRLRENPEGVAALDGEDAALIIPLSYSFAGDGPVAVGHVIVELDRDYIARDFLPELAERWFGVSGEPQVLLAVEAPSGIVYRSEARSEARLETRSEARSPRGDLTVPMFSLRRLESLHNLSPGGPGGPGGLPGSGGGPPRFAHAGRPGAHRHGMGGGSWKLVVTHRAGSLEAAVAGARRRNLAVSFGAFALVLGSLAVMGLAVRRARLLARQQLELVAGITHELNTPLAAIRSAGQNLADGVVAEGGHVRRYGALIEREGARLSGMVAKALEFAGIQSGRRAYRLEAVAVADVVAEALHDSRFLLEEWGIEVERDVPPGLPAVWADRSALRLALVNLLDNAVKYAAAGRFVAVRAAAERGGRQLSLTVSDHGPGIHAEDRPHLFEPFYRGREVAAGGGVPGSGLGLSLVRRIVEAHRGTVSYAAGPGGKGSAFTLHLPLAARPEATGERESAPGRVDEGQEVGEAL